MSYLVCVFNLVCAMSLDPGFLPLSKDQDELAKVGFRDHHEKRRSWYLYLTMIGVLCDQ